MVRLLDIPCIEADPADVIEIMRSPEPVQLTAKDMVFSAQAYIGIVKRDNRPVVHAALHVREIQRSLIFAVAGATIESAMKKGQDFLGCLGFCLEPVPLKYSPAMREVILREIPVILPVEAAQRIRQEKEDALARWRQLVSQPEREEVFYDGQELALAEWTQRKKDQETFVARKQAAAEHLAAEERNNRKLAIFCEAIDPFLQQANADEIAAVERIDRDRLQNLLTAAREEAEMMKKRIPQLEEDLLAEKKRNHQLAREKKMAAALLAECRQQLAQAENARAREAEERRVSELARKDAENRLRALYETAQRMKEQLTSGNAERSRLQQEKEAAERLALQLRQEVLQAEEKSRAAAAARHRARSEEDSKKLAALEEELRQARTLVDRGETERARLAQMLAEANRKRVEETAPAEPPAAAAEEKIGQLQADLRRAAEKEEFLRLEIERLAAQKVAAEKRLAEMEAAGRTPAAIPIGKVVAADSGTGIPPEPPPRVVRRPPPADAFFHVDWDLAGVPYGSPEEICEIRKAMNRVRLSLEGYPDQYCSACLIVAKTEDRKNVFIAFRLSVNNRVLVYVPVSPPETPAAFAKAVKEAEKFLQVVGLDLEAVPLSKNPRQRAKTLETISFLSHPPKNAGNF